MVREVSRNQSKLWEYLINGSLLKIILWVLTFVIVRLIAQFIGKSDFYITLILIYSGYAIVNNIWEFIRAFFRPSEDMQNEALLKIINGIIILVILWGALEMWYWLQGILYAYLIAWSISLIISFGFVIGKKAIGSIKTIKKSTLLLNIKSWFFMGMGILFISAYIGIDQVILGLYNFTHDLGIYSFAYKFTLMYAMICWLLFLSLGPNIAKSTNITKYKKWIKKIALVNWIFIIISELVILIIYKAHLLKIVGLEQYSPSLVVLMLLIIYCYIEPFGNWAYINLISMWKEKTTTWIFFIAAMFNIIGNLILIPKISYYWAIITTIWSYLIFSTLSHIFVKKFLQSKNHII